MALLSLKTRRAARRGAFGTRSSSCAPAAPSSTRSPSSSTQESSAHRRPDIPFDEAPQALAHVEGGRAKGKVVITKYMFEMVPPGA